MKLIESKAEYIPQEDGLEGIYKQIELAGRTAHKSEDKMIDIINIDIANLPENINIENIPNYKENKRQCIEYLCNHNIKYQVISSAKDFVDRMIKSKHEAALEHGTVYLYFSYKENEEAWIKYTRDLYSKVIPKYNHTEGNPHNEFYFFDRCVTINYRILVENNWLDDLQYLCSPTEFHEKRYTMRFTCSRAIAQELTMHRVFSFLIESQRYINYSKERHEGEIIYIIPSWCNFEPTQIEEYGQGNLKHTTVGEYALLSGLLEAEEYYKTMLSDNCTPQQARDVLPNATKTELIMTGFASDWRHLMDLRLFGKTGAPHPDIVDLMQKAQKSMQEASIWEDIMKYPSKFE